jgi:thiamine pyrophosphate-dependent acetolactate synthase large subunit-like protein
MKNIPIYAALAQAFAAEGVDTHFTLMGDGNMHWAAAMKSLDGMSTFAVRHEHCACAMAIGYHSATGKVGVASVTCGPGLTQITTALAVAARGRIPLVVFAGEAPINAKWYNQAIEQPPFAAAAGAHYISAHSPARMYQYVREAFYVARHKRRPVVLGVPYDLQKQPLPDIGDYQPAAEVLPVGEALPPHPRQVDRWSLDGHVPAKFHKRLQVGVLFQDPELFLRNRSSVGRLSEPIGDYCASRSSGRASRRAALRR